MNRAVPQMICPCWRIWYGNESMMQRDQPSPQRHLVESCGVFGVRPRHPPDPRYVAECWPLSDGGGQSRSHWAAIDHSCPCVKSSSSGDGWSWWSGRERRREDAIRGQFRLNMARVAGERMEGCKACGHEAGLPEPKFYLRALTYRPSATRPFSSFPPALICQLSASSSDLSARSVVHVNL